MYIDVNYFADIDEYIYIVIVLCKHFTLWPLQAERYFCYVSFFGA